VHGSIEHKRIYRLRHGDCSPCGLCNDDDDNDDDDGDDDDVNSDWITLWNHGDQKVVRGSIEHKRICNLEFEKCCRFHNWARYYEANNMKDDDDDEEEEEEQKNESANDCDDDDDYDDDDDVDYITLRNHGHQIVERGSVEHKLLCQVNFSASRRQKRRPQKLKAQQQRKDVRKARKQEKNASKNTSNNNIPTVWRNEREKSQLKSKARARKEQMQYSVCYDNTQYDNDDEYVEANAEWITLRNHGHIEVVVGSIEHKRICGLDIEQCRRLHNNYFDYDYVDDEEEEEEGKYESDNEETNEVDVGVECDVTTNTEKSHLLAGHTYVLDAHQSSDIDSLNSNNLGNEVGTLALVDVALHDDDDAKLTQVLEEMNSEEEVRGGGRLPKLRVGAWLKRKVNNAVESTSRAVSGIKWIFARI
jgi:hypothetical protein